MHLIDALNKRLVQVDLHVDSKKRALEIIGACFADQHSELDATPLFEALMARERLGSTGIGQGVAIPHCRATGITSCMAGIFRLEHPINYDAIDNQQVDIVVALVVPEEEPKAHLELLANIAEIFNNHSLCTQIRQAPEANDIYQLIAQPES